MFGPVSSDRPSQPSDHDSPPSVAVLAPSVVAGGDRLLDQWAASLIVHAVGAMQ
jgi:hypothetical protein